MKDLIPIHFLVAWYDPDDRCFDEDRFDNLIDACAWNKYEYVSGSDYIKVFAIIKLFGKYRAVELFCSKPK